MLYDYKKKIYRKKNRILEYGEEMSRKRSENLEEYL
jgi:hypothetical protein